MFLFESTVYLTLRLNYKQAFFFKVKKRIKLIQFNDLEGRRLESDQGSKCTGMHPPFLFIYLGFSFILCSRWQRAGGGRSVVEEDKEGRVGKLKEEEGEEEAAPGTSPTSLETLKIRFMFVMLGEEASLILI